MAEIWFIADTHFGDERILAQRPFFDTIQAHDLEVSKRWNTLIAPKDIVYCLGDIGSSSFFDNRDLHGFKHMVLGNHEEGSYTTEDHERLDVTHISGYARFKAYPFA